MSFSFKGGDKLRRYLADLSQKSQQSANVQVGVFSGATYEDGTPVVTVAAAQELGTGTIPARPFLRRTVAEKSNDWPRALAALLAHNGLDPNNALDRLGSQIGSEVQDTLATITDPPLAESTIKARARAGSENPAKPLQDTLRLTNSITHRVEGNDDGS